MIWKIISFGGFEFTEENDLLAFLDERDNPRVQPSISSSMIKRGAHSPPVSGEIVLEGDYLVVTVIVHSTSAYEAMLKEIDISDGKPKKLVGKDEHGNSWYVMARLIKHTRTAVKNTFTFEVPDPIWRSVSEKQESWHVTESGQQHVLTVAGTRSVKPVIRLTPREVKTGGYGYLRWVRVYNVTQWQINNYSLDITGGKALNTAALVAAGKCQADGDDIHVMVNGVEVSRWLTGMNTENTGVIITLDFSPMAVGTLLTAISGSGVVDYIFLERVAYNATFLAKLATAKTKLLLIDNEVFSFTGVDVKNYLITGVSRAQRGTSMATHTAKSWVRWIEHDIYLMYGNSSVDAPEEDVSKKPMWDIDASSNTEWVYDEFLDTEYAGRPGSWTGAVLLSTGKQSHLYSGDHGESANPAIRMGMRGLAYMLNGNWRSEMVYMEYKIAGIGFTHVSTSGEKYRSSISWAIAAGLQKYTNQYYNVWSTPAPAQAQTWESFEYNNVSLGGSCFYIRYTLYASLAAIANNEIDLQINSVTLKLDSTRVPLVLLGAEQDNYWADTTIKVEETGDEIKIRGVSPLNKTVEIDCGAKTVTLNGENAYAMLSLNSKRDSWLDLPPGTITLTITDEGVSDLEVSVKFVERSL